ncbi:ferritin family protein [Desulforamulus aeronauticus]|uniref:Rubrerythrin n=1 Tax=Desulforamulus aeronauticus DSM 10349 TaxID=1121421 RepID=A0A1M6NCJ1_9FIRM|nr:ferritin family protein [Desulforamulus aeronauticus]SHJ93409.1 Rubrerythrin [Desulforamulus aeronauticus DSM 10349]
MESCSPELQAIKTAILNEHEGHQFYLLAAEKGGSDEVRNVFLYLAEEEQRHEYYLRRLYDAVENNIDMKKAEENCNLVKAPNIFKEEDLKREKPSLIVSALSMAVKMEKESLEFYREASAKTKDEKARKVYLELAEMEGEHLDTLNLAYDFAKNEWWAEQGFSPA